MGSGNSGHPITGTISIANLYGAESRNINFSAFAASTVFTVPANVNRLYCVVAGGGGGGGVGASRGGDMPGYFSGGDGGAGGLALGYLAVSPGADIVVTVGAGGGSATNGGSSSFSTLSAGGGTRGTNANGVSGTNGTNGAAGVGTGGNIANSNSSTTIWSTNLPTWTPTLVTNTAAFTNIANQTYAINTSGGAVAWTSAGTGRPGRGGNGGGGSVLTPVTGIGGVGGAVIILY